MLMLEFFDIDFEVMNKSPVLAIDMPTVNRYAEHSIKKLFGWINPHLYHQLNDRAESLDFHSLRVYRILTYNQSKFIRLVATKKRDSMRNDEPNVELVVFDSNYYTDVAGIAIPFAEGMIETRW